MLIPLLLKRALECQGWSISSSTIRTSKKTVGFSWERYRADMSDLPGRKMTPWLWSLTLFHFVSTLERNRKNTYLYALLHLLTCPNILLSCSLVCSKFDVVRKRRSRGWEAWIVEKVGRAPSSLPFRLWWTCGGIVIQAEVVSDRVTEHTTQFTAQKAEVAFHRGKKI